MPAYEGVVAAATATYRGAREDGGSAGSRPVYTAITLASNFAAFESAVAITVALIARERDGLGQRIEVPLYDAMFEAFGGAAGLPSNMRGGGGGAGGGDSRIYQCKDGRWVHFAAFQPRFYEWLADAAGMSTWRDEGLLGGRREAYSAGPAELRRRVEELFKTRTALEWEELGKQAGLPLSLCRTNQEWIDHDHARTSRCVIEVHDPELGLMWQPGFPVSLSGAPAQTSPRHTLDADRAAVIASLDAPRHGAATAPGPRLGRALEGIRIVDTTEVLAAPTAGRIMADYGADVIKVNKPRDAAILEHVHLNRGKRSVLIDLKQPEGLDVLLRLADGADVFMQNFTKGQAEKLGFGYEQVRARKPDIVYMSVSAYNHDGPWGAGRGYEPMGQATTGMKDRAGGDGPPASQPFALNDYGTGVMGAFSIALGLYHKLRTGQGQHVQASLAQTATYHQTPYFSSYAGKVSDEPRGQQALGTGPLYRLYEAADAWFFLAAKASQLAAVEGFAGLDGLTGTALEAALEERLRLQPAAVWVERLRAAGAGAHLLKTVPEIMDDPWAVAHGLSLLQEVEGAGTIRRAGPPPRLSRTPMRPGVAHAPGSDGRAVLEEIGLGPKAAELVDRGIVPSRPITGRQEEPAGATRSA